MTDLLTNGQPDDYWPGLEAGIHVATPPVPPPPPPAPAATVAPPRPAPVTSAGALNLPVVEAWPVHPPETPPLVEKTTTRPPAKRPKAELEKTVDEDAPSTIRDRWKAQRPFYRAVVLIIVAVFLFLASSAVLNHIGSVIGSAGAKSTATQSQQFLDALNAQRTPQVATINVANPLSWLPCPLTPDAKTAISYDPPGGTTLNAARASAVDQQAHLLLSEHTASELRITAPDSTHLVVFVGAPATGVPLIDCSQSNSAVPQVAPTTTAPR